MYPHTDLSTHQYGTYSLSCPVIFVSYALCLHLLSGLSTSVVTGDFLHVIVRTLHFKALNFMFEF